LALNELCAAGAVMARLNFAVFTFDSAANPHTSIVAMVFG